jgi:hypothetical protein
MDTETALMFSTEDPYVDRLVTELVSPDALRERSEEILEELHLTPLSIFQKKQILGSIQLHWHNAVRQAKQEGLFSDQPTSLSIVDQIYPVYRIHAEREFDLK